MLFETTTKSAVRSTRTQSRLHNRQTLPVHEYGLASSIHEYAFARLAQTAPWHNTRTSSRLAQAHSYLQYSQ